MGIMKILYIVHDNKKGGAAVSFLEMVSEIRKTNEIFVLTPHKRGYIPNELDKMGIQHKNAHYYWWFVATPTNKILRLIKRSIYWLAVKSNLGEAYRIRKFVVTQKFDIIHTNSSVINFGGLLSQITGIPHVWHIREFAQEDFSLVPVISKKEIYNFINGNASSIIAISKAIYDKYTNFIEPSRLVLVYNGVKQNKVEIKSRIRESYYSVNFLIAGNICKEKGQEDVIRAANKLIKKGILSFQIWIAGGGDTSILDKQVIKLELDNQVTILGQVENMQELRAKMDVEIVGSRCEAFGRVTIEAMRASNPVIGTNTGGTKELIKDGSNGFLYTYGDVVMLAELMKKFILNPSLINEMGERAYRSVYNKFTPEENAMRILDVYKEVRKD